MKKLCITAGGSGGHVLPGIAIAEVWAKEFGKESVLFLGSHGMEQKLVPQYGFSLQTMNIGALNRVSWRRRWKTFFQLPWALVQACILLLRFKPHSVLGVGGYSSGPVLLMACLMKKMGLLSVHTAILEQNSIMGWTNRILGKYVDTIFTCFEFNHSTTPSKVVVTGNPLRSSIRVTPCQRKNFHLFIFGGSQGAMGLNTLVLEALPFLTSWNLPLTWTHQTGKKDYQRVLETYQRFKIEARVESFIEDMASVYQVASLVICRAGSSTLSELASVGRASILVPLPTSSDNHQYFNAKLFSDQNASCLLLQTEENAKILAEKIRFFYENPSSREAMEKQITLHHRACAAEKIVDILKA
jgi:UDP-N-acetylglucosamine--N-acetylmuramyl-(pentapeptide) pyrophosphoryl-undecaprenol N-acetylglucosamine transferase